MLGEYDGNNNLLRKYMYGPGIDQPVCMIEVADANATYYYHFDALGSVVALSDANGDTVQTYEYSVYGEVAVEDANHPNPYMFAGRRFAIEIGLYYNRARYYNPFTGRFLQTDPIGYGDDINSYRYCRNRPLYFVDPSGLEPKLAKNIFGKVVNNPGWVDDRWTRPPGHADATAWPAYTPWPYYYQTYAMGCAPIGVLNWWLTYDQPLKHGEKVGLPDGYQKNDVGAQDYVGYLIDPTRDWNKQGVKSLSELREVIDPDHERTEHFELDDRVPSASEIIHAVVQEEKAVMVGYNLDAKYGGAWHVAIIVPTPVDYFEAVEASPDLVISVITGFNTEPRVYNRSDFRAWWAERVKAGVWHEYIVGEPVPGRK